jgi:hypothetical protein
MNTDTDEKLTPRERAQMEPVDRIQLACAEIEETLKRHDMLDRLDSGRLLKVFNAATGREIRMYGRPIVQP